MKSKLLTNSVVTFLSFAAAGAAFAQSEGTSESEMDKSMRPGDQRAAMYPAIGIYGGAAVQNGEAYVADPSFMVDVSFTPFGSFNLAAQAQHEPSSLNLPGRPDFNTTNLLLKETFTLGGGIPVIRDMFIGAKTGVTIYSGDVPTRSQYAVGGTAGFDIPLSPAHQVTFGAEGTYLAVVGTDDNNLTPDQTSVLGSMKYWF